MRLDLFLKASRLSPRRTGAQKLCEAGLVLLNDRPAKAAHIVKIGDEITIRRGDRLTRIRIALVPNTRQISRKEAATLYELLSDEELADEL